MPQPGCKPGWRGDDRRDLAGREQRAQRTADTNHNIHCDDNAAALLDPKRAADGQRYADAKSNEQRNTHPWFERDADNGANTHRDIDINSVTVRITHRHEIANTIVDSHRHGIADTDRNRDTNCNGDADSHRQPDPHGAHTLL